MHPFPARMQLLSTARAMFTSTMPLIARSESYIRPLRHGRLKALAQLGVLIDLAHMPAQAIADMLAKLAPWSGSHYIDHRAAREY